MNKILITNALLLNEGQQQTGDLLIKEGRIEQIGSKITPDENTRVIDAKGKLLMPGMIDDQVHFRDPGVTYKADISTESRAAAAGGITSFMDMPNTIPNTVTLEALEEKYQAAIGRSLTNYAFHLGATNDNIDVIRALKPNQTCAIKIFMGASTGNMLVDNPDTLDLIFRDACTPILTHCEDTPTILVNEEIYRKKYGEEIPMKYHPAIRSEEACFISSSLAVELAKRHDTRLHVLHLTTEKELSLFSKDALDQKNITVEACIHHLWFNDADYETKGSLIKCNPAVKKESDRLALLKAVMEDKIDVIATDHAPHTIEEKANKSYFKAPSGLPLVQHAIPMLLELYFEGHLTLEKIVEKACHAPARLFDIAERGYLREGYMADLILVDLNKPNQVKREDVLYKCGWSPLEGSLLRTQVTHTFVNGHLVYENGKVIDNPVGERLCFKR